MSDQTVVLSGGGANGAYEIGVLKALFQGKGPGGAKLRPGTYTGTSVGTFNAAFMASPKRGEKPPETLSRLDEVWREVIAEQPENCGNGVFRIRADPLPFLSPRCWLRNPAKPITDLARDGLFLGADSVARLAYFGTRFSQSAFLRLLELPDLSAVVSSAPMDDLVRSHIDLARLRESPIQFRAVASDWTHGKPSMFTKAEMSDEIGHRIILASAAIPAVFPPIQIGDITYVDGGVLMNTPLDPALDAWRSDPKRSAELTLHVIYLDPTLADMKLPKVSSTWAITNRLILSIFAYNANTHIESAARANPVVREQIRATGKSAPKSGAKLEKPLLTIHRYRPKSDLDGALGLLEFGAARIGRIIEQGFDETSSHDCEKEGCVLPE